MCQNNLIFSILVPKPLFILFQFFFSKESKIYCISDCLQKGRNSAKLDCLFSTKNVTCFRNLEQMSRVPTKNDQYFLKEQRLHKIEARFGLDTLKTLKLETTLILTKLLLYVRFGTDFKLSSSFYCCMSQPYCACAKSETWFDHWKS